MSILIPVLARLLVIAGCSLVIIGGAAAENKVALVIGNDHYPRLGPDHQLQKAINDARAVGDALAKDGFQVLRGNDLTRAEMVDKLFDLTAHLQAGDTALFYFAGHGVSLGSGNYLLPTDVPEVEVGQEMRVASQSIAEADVIADLQQKGARVAIVILDACRDNPFKQAGARSMSLDRGLRRAPDANGVFSLYSAGYGQSALDRLSDDDPNPNSVFTRVLVPLLTRPGLNIDDLAYQVREDVAKLAASTPDHHQQIPAAYDQIIGGRVYLASSAGSEAAASAVPASPAPVPPAAAPSPPVAVAKLEPPPAPAAPARTVADDAVLASALQTELNRLGCDAGPVDGHWTMQSRIALLRFGQRRKLTLNVDQPDSAVLDQLRGEKGTVCPVAKAVPEPPPVVSHPKPRKPPPQVAVDSQPAHRARPTAAAPRAPAAASSCFMFNGQRVCE